MANWHKILDLCATEYLMDYCEEFDTIKSILENANKNGKPFSKMCFRSGHETIISELENSLDKAFKNYGFFDGETSKPLSSAEHNLRKILMFLLLNTDASYAYHIKDDVLVGHVVEICPALPKFVTMSLVWDLHLSKFFYEAIAYTPYWFALQHIEAAVESLKYIENPIELISVLELLMCAILKNITRTLACKMNGTVDRKIVYTKFYGQCILLLRQFYTPDAQKFESLTTYKRHRYAGFAFQHLLRMALCAIDYYEDPSKAMNIDIDDIAIYEIGKGVMDDEKRIDTKKDDKAGSLIKDQLHQIIMALLNTLETHVMTVSVEVYIYWVEIDITSRRTLQQDIGEATYHLCERLQANESLTHSVEKQLKFYAKKPKSLTEMVKESTIGQILNTLEDKNITHETRKAYLDELYKRPEIFGNEECVQTLHEIVTMISIENVQAVLDYIKLCHEAKRNEDQLTSPSTSVGSSEEVTGSGNFEENNRNDCEDADSMDIDAPEIDCNSLKLLVLESLTNFSTEDLVKLLIYQKQIFGPFGMIFNVKPDFEERASQFICDLRLASGSTFDIQNFLCLCFENSIEMWKHYFEYALENQKSIINFCSTVKKTRSYSWFYFSKLLTQALSEQKELSNGLFPNFLCEVYFSLFFPDSKREFVTKFLNRQMTAACEAEDFSKLLPIVKGLIMISDYGETQTYKPLNFAELTSPMLVTVALVMDKARWNLYCFTHQREELVRVCVQFIQNTSKKFLPAATEKDRDWICAKIKQCVDPLTQYYFQKFGLKPTECQMEFDQFLRLNEPQPLTEKSEIIKFLAINLVYCTAKETEWLVRSDKLRPHIHTAMCWLAQSIELDNINNITNYRFCLGNYASILKKVLMPQSNNDIERLESLLRNVLKVLSVTPSPIYNEAVLDFKPLLMDMLREISLSGIPRECFESLEKVLQNMPEGKSKDIILKKFKSFDPKKNLE